MNDLGLRAVSVLGFVVFAALAWATSSAKRQVPWRTVAFGVGLQLALGVLLLRTGFGRAFFDVVNAGVAALLSYTEAGSRFVFGPLMDTGFSFALNVLPIIVFMGSVFAVLYQVGVLQRIVDVLAAVLSKTMRLSGAESLAAVANVFMGMVESALVVKPYLEGMTRSELFTLMTLGMSTVAGSVLVAYVGMLGGGDFAGHLVTASLISAPAGLMLAKIIIPETETPQTIAGGRSVVPQKAANVIDAAAEGALGGLRLAAYVGALLLAFVALIALLDDAVGLAGGLFGAPELSFSQLLGYVMAPAAWLMGIPWEDAREVGSMLGIKTVLNEFLAYQALGDQIAAGTLQPRSARIASYALCGFANFGSLAILLGGIGGMAPSRRGEVARLGLLSIWSGTLATFMTACVAGMLL